MSAEPITVHVLSDSLGETGELVARAAIAQFVPDSFHIEQLPRVWTPEQVREVVRAHCGTHCIFLYTLVNRPLLEEMQRLCAEGVNGVDLLGPSVEMLAAVTGITPSGEAGAVRRTDAEYFQRLEAMEFAVKHDDGRNAEGLPDADIVLIGASRTGKTPLAMYLAVKGWRVANVPLATGIVPPKQLFHLDPRRVFGLVMDVDVLVGIRRARMKEMGALVPGYADREAVEVELEEARGVMRKIGCLVLHTEHRAVEEVAQEVIRHTTIGQTTRD